MVKSKKNVKYRYIVFTIPEEFTPGIFTVIHTFGRDLNLLNYKMLLIERFDSLKQILIIFL